MKTRDIDANDKPVRFRSSLAGSERPASANPKVMIFQQDQALREALATLLEMEGNFEVLATESGPRGLETFLRERPNLVIIDLELSNREDMRLVGEVNERSPEVPILLLTQDMAPVASALPNITVLRKPFPTARLLSEIRAALWGRDPRDGGDTAIRPTLRGVRVL